jgi:single stranded DNA-binding protein
MKTLMFDGHVGRDGAVVKTTRTGKQYATFSVANKSFSNGEEKVEWFEVVSYDSNFIEKRAQYLGKGSYVIISGSLKTEVRPDQTGKLWINHYVTANTIDTPRISSKNSEQGVQVSTQEVPVVSVYTGDTASEVYSTPSSQVQVVGAKTSPTIAIPSPQVQVSTFNNENIDEDELPF